MMPYPRGNHYRPRLSEQYPELVIIAGLLICLGCGWYVAHSRFYFSHQQLMEVSVCCALGLTWVLGVFVLVVREKANLDKQWPKAPILIPPSKAARDRQRAHSEDSIILGYDSYRRPWFWSDHIRSMQSILLGTSGSGKTTLLKSIIVQDIYRESQDGHRIPMVILDGKGDLDFFYSLIPHIHQAGRLHQFRVINPDLPEWSVGYNPFFSNDDDYMAQVNMIFGSFNLHDEFFAKHQLNYLADIVRVLVYTKQQFNFYDVIVMALDKAVLEEQSKKAIHEISKDNSISAQRRLNFEMSVNNLFQSLRDRERVPKIQGLLNECMTFLDDEMSIITGPYDDLLAFDDVLNEELILFVSLNTNKNTEPVRALGKMLLQNLQLMVGKRYADAGARSSSNRALFSVVLDEFAPFGYNNFPKILNTARGTNTAMLFSMQSLPQLLTVSKGFMQDVSSAPNTTLCMRTRDRETCDYLIKASSEQRVERRSLSIMRRSLFNPEHYQTTGHGNVTEINEYRIPDEQIKYLPKGQMHVLQSDDTCGMLTGLLHVSPIHSITPHGYEPILYKRPTRSRKESKGAYLRFKDPAIAKTSKPKSPTSAPDRIPSGERSHTHVLD